MGSRRRTVRVPVEPLERRVFLDGALVSDWGPGGLLFLKPTRDVTRVAPRPDGSLIVHARRYSHDEFLYRLGTDGQVDVDYGDIDGSEPRVGFDVGAQSDNRLLYATGFEVARYSATGVREGEFRGPKLNGAGAQAGLTAFAVLPDDSFAVAGDDDLLSPNWSGIEWFDADGTHRVSIEQDDAVLSLAGQADGKLLALLRTGAGYTVNRYQPDGRLDDTFANGALLPAPTEPGFSSTTAYSSISIDAQGRIYVGGHLPVTDADYTGSAVARLLPDGALDTSYSGDGLATGWPAAVVGWGTAFRAAPDGRMYVAATLWPGEEDVMPAVWRLNADGSPDRTWGVNGQTVLDVTFTQGGAAVRDLELMPDGDVVVSGTGARAPMGEPHWEVGYVFRLEVDPEPAPAQIVNLDGVVTVIGRTDRDVIHVKTLPDGRISATANGVTRRFAASSVHGVVVTAGSGDDLIDVSALAPITSSAEDFPVRLFGEAGDDVIVGSRGADAIVGDEGADRLAGLDGGDMINGLAGADWISGGGGADTLVGGGGRDHLGGDDGDDTLYGGDQGDVLAGGDGDDSLLGEGGHDQIHGGAGADRFFGAGGNDTFFSADGIAETLIGGLAGTDTANADEDDLLIGIEVPVIG